MSDNVQLNNYKRANTKEGYYVAKRNHKGTEKTQIMEWLTVAHIDSLSTEVNSSDDAYVKIPKDKLIEYGVISQARSSRDVMRLHREMAKLIIMLETPKKTLSGKQSTVLSSVVVFPEVTYDIEEELVTVKVSGKATPQFYQLAGFNHTQLNIDIVLKNITGFWARKIYAICREQLYHNSDIIEFKFTLKEFRSALGIADDDLYSEFKIFNRDLLTPALWELGWNFSKQKHVDTPTPKKPVADIDLYIRAEKITQGRKTTGIKFQVRPKSIKQPSLIGRAPEAITMPTREYLTSINWSQWNLINQLSETNGSLVVERAVVDFRDNHAKNAKKNVAGLLSKKLSTLVQNVLNNQSQEERQQQRNQRGKALLDKWKVSHPFEEWAKTQKEKLVQFAKNNGITMPEEKPYTEKQWHDAGVGEIKKVLDKEEAENKQQRLF
jgi:hypothetical protein